MHGPLAIGLTDRSLVDYIFHELAFYILGQLMCVASLPHISFLGPRYVISLSNPCVLLYILIPFGNFLYRDYHGIYIPSCSDCWSNFYAYVDFDCACQFICRTAAVSDELYVKAP